MPLYEFECRQCQHAFEELVSIRFDPKTTVTCPSCGADSAVRVLSATASLTSGSTSGGGSCAPRGGFS
jgi:putative FmdB family regulatory protein